MKLKTLDEIGNIQTGTTPKTSEPENFGDYIPFIKPSDFNADGTLCLESCEYLSEIGIGKGRLIPKHSVLMTCIGSIGKCGYNDIDVSCNQQINALTPHNDNYKYIYYVMKSGEFQTRIQNICPKTVVPIINKTLWGKLEISLPSREEQDKIVSILDKADEIRAKKKLANDKLDEFLKSTFISMFGDPVNDKTIPKEYLEKYLVYVQNGISRRRKIPQNIGEIVFRIKEIRENYIDYSDVNRIPLDDKEKDKYRINTNELLFIRVNGNKDYVGRNTVFRGYNEDTFFNDHIMRVKINESELNPIYLSRFLNLPFGKEEIKKYVKTSAGQFTINQQGLGSVELPIPPIEDQNKFAQIVEKVEAQKQKNELVIEQMNNLFNSLSQRAFKGEL